MILSSLNQCNARLLSVGGTCATDANSIYANILDPKFSKTELINHGDYKTHSQLVWEKEQAQAAVHHHFS
ncbi:hypothetical protein GUITHDRAFT_109822 [Guillardia theta CCMP2712]|uniref:Uncharacterized protein n=1 Tax=Guillardia theta (strain CCMP2712) TaxID=905079 RepID=L1J760_GUITC|nr:hypothetical protein GUITHDRAFT_109822 [Guillardia theta CCMP2712]EKX44373.1 hypothetical protein GUITHDRAFT_109822 [Guillardia theta CCMP2712]|eukprot:XP_005831353.1 hypothetical protein GUITHDRAFT_109822 [Guillardia theta CCMP2712]